MNILKDLPDGEVLAILDADEVKRLEMFDDLADAVDQIEQALESVQNILIGPAPKSPPPKKAAHKKVRRKPWKKKKAVVEPKPPAPPSEPVVPPRPAQGAETEQSKTESNIELVYRMAQRDSQDIRAEHALKILEAHGRSSNPKAVGVMMCTSGKRYFNRVDKGLYRAKTRMELIKDAAEKHGGGDQSF